MIKAIDVVYIHTPHRELGDWYKNILSLEPGFSDDHWQEFVVENGSRFALDFTSYPKSVVEKQSIMISFIVDDIKVAVKKLSSMGVKFYPSTAETIFDVGPAFVATFQDPDGNWLQLSQPKT